MSDNNNEEPDFKELYKNLLNDPNFEKLETELQKPNIFSILGIGRAEIRHSNFLAWLLDPNESHGLGNRFLIRVLRDLALEKNNDLDIVTINKLNFSNVEVGKEVKCPNGSIDLLINFKDEHDKLIICIENKFDTIDSVGQLGKYKNFIQDDESFKGYTKKIFVYLTPIGDNPKNFDGDEWNTYSYKKIVNHLENIQETAIDTIVKTYISDYITTLKREIMGTNDKVTELANAIYNENREIFQFVIDNISDEVNRVTWEDDKNKWLKEFGEKIIKKVQEEDQDKTKKYELGFTKSYISIKRGGQKIYSLWPRTKPNYSMDFDFAASESGKKDIIKKSIIELLEKLKNIDNDRLRNLKWSDGSYFTINNVNLLSDDNLKEIQKIRFGNNDDNSKI
ncbi:hypothetical protein D0T50_03835 [Bacteroides sp. 214]|uniref:PDDEXK-like family protein n=1 Tax=Bacteroides sp. 214 TaxID=2302935 RepID=UPI0013D72CCD|nr:PD-(D/E)XK nuclease family protein [Bacteroides sp. 214]NDW12017.1 hypothetical protein [Bacteroides sp. 214]